ncbi:tellurite resistance TerB family protein [Pantoea sp. Mb-10]|uniref:tellurite resistance TerB family protein n=1 Tax=unclassified Pantoea TaxID=2630326 RepID=UPI001E341A98|nr:MULTISPECIES: DUF533 domain-containing protein [unclassified Pantoea]MCE0491399.1 tellurite resistance TerB family protein [Pantoea sp. Mb-10]MCE0502213.1 tellurite resistance TerB family protein [Pantoea sp. Pb-8]
MSHWLQQIQSLLTKKSSTSASGLSDMLAPGALGGLAGLLVSSQSARKLLTKYGGKALIIGGGAAAGTVLWRKYQQRIRESHQDEPGFGQQASPPDQRAARLITALVFAAKSDGHIDARERQHLDDAIHQAGYGAQAEALIQQALARPLDPQGLAAEVKNEQEALELYLLSCAAIDIDHFMERSYLAALGEALKIPPDVQADIQRDIAAEQAA